MSTYYTAILAIGKEFDYASEIVDYLKERNLLSAEELAFLDDDCEGNGFITEICWNHKTLPTCQCLNLYYGDTYYLGFKVSVHDVDNFKRSVDEAIEKWRNMFDEEPDIIHTVRVS